MQSFFHSEISLHRVMQPIFHSEIPLHRVMQPIFHSEIPLHRVMQPISHSEIPLHRMMQLSFRSGNDLHQLMQITFQIDNILISTSPSIRQIKTSPFPHVVGRGELSEIIYFLFFTSSAPSHEEQARSEGISGAGVPS